MKYILILVLLAFSICEDDKKKAVGSWEKHSFNENSIEIDQSFRQAAKDYCKTHDVEPDDLIRLTVYSQLVNGVNYKITFMDPSSEYPTIEEYRIYKARGNKPEDYKAVYDEHKDEIPVTTFYFEKDSSGYYGLKKVETK